MVITSNNIGTSAVGLSLAATGKLKPEEQEMIEQVQSQIKQLDEGEYLQREGDEVSDCYFVREGWLVRRREGFQGGRYATNVFLPGDVFAMHLGFRRRALFDIVAATPSEVSIVDFEELGEVVKVSDNIGNALDWNSARSFNILSEHLVANMSLEAPRRVLHILLEFWCRLMVVGQASDKSFELPLTQSTIGHLLGLTNVSVSKAISTLRQAGLIDYKNRTVTLNDVEECIDYSTFDPAFLEMFEPRGSSRLQDLI